MIVPIWYEIGMGIGTSLFLMPLVFNGITTKNTIRSELLPKMWANVRTNVLWWL